MILLNPCKKCLVQMMCSKKKTCVPLSEYFSTKECLMFIYRVIGIFIFIALVIGLWLYLCHKFNFHESPIASFLYVIAFTIVGLKFFLILLDKTEYKGGYGPCQKK